MQDDSNGVMLLDAIAGNYNDINPDEGLRWAMTELSLAQKIHWRPGEANARNNIGINHQGKGNNPAALEAFFQALKIWEELGIPEGIGVTSGNIGIVYKVQQDYARALSYCLKALKIAEETGNKHRLQSALGNVGNILEAQGRYSEALTYKMKALHTAEALHDTEAISTHTGNIGISYMFMKQYPAALAYTFKSLRLAEQLGEQQGAAGDIGNIGEAYVEIARAPADPVPDSLVPAGRSANLTKGIEYLRRGIEASRACGYNEAIVEFSRYLSEALALRGDYRAALAAYQQFIAVRDSLYNMANNEQIARLETRRELDLKDKQIIIDRLAVEKKRNERVLFSAGFVLLLIVVVIVIRNIRLSTAKELSENKLNALQARMNPHFIFNSLSSIQSLILNDEKEQSMDYLSEFSILMRQILDNSGQGKVTLKTEIDMLRSYIELEHLRFDGFSRCITVADNIATESIEVPGMILQPFVENAILHGLVSKGDAGRLDITFERDEKHIICTVEDNGVGREHSAEINKKRSKGRQSHGTTIATNRLTLLNDRKRRLVNKVTYVDKTEGGVATGTKVIIELPILSLTC